MIFRLTATISVSGDAQSFPVYLFPPSKDKRINKVDIYCMVLSSASATEGKAGMFLPVYVSSFASTISKIFHEPLVGFYGNTHKVII